MDLWTLINLWSDTLQVGLSHHVLEESYPVGGPVWQPEGCLPQILPSGILGLPCAECELRHQDGVHICLGLVDCSAINRGLIPGKNRLCLHQQQPLYGLNHARVQHLMPSPPRTSLKTWMTMGIQASTGLPWQHREH